MVPSEWTTASLPHHYAVYRVSWFKKMHTCLCGATGWSAKALWADHCRIENEARAWLQKIEQMKAYNLERKRQQGEAQTQQRRRVSKHQVTAEERLENLQRYQEFQRSLQQNSSPGSASFYE